MIKKRERRSNENELGTNKQGNTACWKHVNKQENWILVSDNKPLHKSLKIFDWSGWRKLFNQKESAINNADVILILDRFSSQGYKKYKLNFTIYLHTINTYNTFWKISYKPCISFFKRNLPTQNIPTFYSIYHLTSHMSLCCHSLWCCSFWNIVFSKQICCCHPVLAFSYCNQSLI